MRLFDNKLTVVGLFITISLVVLALAAPLIASHDPAQINIEEALLSPSGRHLFGTDGLGRDIFSRIVYGSRISLFVGLIAVGIALIIGVIIGAVSGYYGGRVDNFIMRFVDMMLCFPTFFLMLSVIAVLEPNIVNIMIIIGITGWMGIARLVRAEMLSLKEREFILAARAMGASDLRIITRHLIPNAIEPVLVSAVLGMASAILTESGLSFLGLGVQPPTPSWGNILMEGKGVLGVAWWNMLFPGIFILITVLGYNLLGEGLRDFFDKRK